MPTAQNFYASGAGNGFPFCYGLKVNVSDEDYWTTLSGYNKTHADMGIDVTQEQISTSLANASRLYWDTYGITGTASATFDQSASNSYSHSIANVSVDDQDNPFFGQPIPVPRERICSGRSPLARKRDDVQDEGFLQILMYLELTLLYNGFGEGNFVGYGMPIAKVEAQSRWNYSSCQIRLSYSANALSPYLSGYFDQSIGYVELYGMHFVANCEAGSRFQDDSSYSVTRSTSLSPLSASITVNRTLGNPSSLWQASSSAEMTSLDFYTYT